jgi:LacI family transcriptional regulator
MVRRSGAAAVGRDGGPTLRDVAEHAGVSIATVSRVLGGTYPTAAATRAKVMDAVQELDYVANAQARALAGAGAKTVAILLSSIGNEFAAGVAQGVEEQAVREGRICLVASTGGNAERELAIVRLMREQRTDAVILVGTVVADQEYRSRMSRYAHSLAAAGSRLVLIGRPPLSPDVPAIAVEYDNTGGAYAATSHLLSQGHDRILYLGHHAGQTTFEIRLDGYRRALTDHRVPYDESLVVPGWVGRANGYRMMSERLATGPADFTAVFAADDLTAAGALRALRERGLRVPDDLSMVGYNDLPVAADLCLTTVHVPKEKLGRTAIRLALHERDTRSPGPVAIRRVLGTHLVVRDSVRPRAAVRGAGS